MKVILSDSQSAFIEANSTIINDGESDWFYIPFWWKKVDDVCYEMVSFEKLPNHVKEIIKELREKRNENSEPTNY